jgi:hypothetical protein
MEVRAQGRLAVLIDRFHRMALEKLARLVEEPP